MANTNDTEAKAAAEKAAADKAATEKAAAEKAAVKLEAHIVAPGRTVATDDGDVGPGGEVMLDPREAKRLGKLGFLVGEDGTVALNTNGPAVNVDDGVQVKTA